VKKILPGHVQRKYPLFDLLLNEVYFHNDVIGQLGIVAVTFLPYKDLANRADKLWPNLISNHLNPILKALSVEQVCFSYAINKFVSLIQLGAEFLLEIKLEQGRVDYLGGLFFKMVFIQLCEEIERLFKHLLVSLLQCGPEPFHS